jgi:predicted esterase YcpF (UPF0227 family)
MNKQEILTKALEARHEEIMNYQINIDNYTLAVEHINASGDEDLIDFAEKLNQLLRTEKIEQKKAKVIRDVIQKQLEV